MKRRNSLVLCGVVLLAGLSAGAADAQRLPGCNDPRGVARYLRLSQEQATAWRELRSELRTAVEPIKAQVEPLAEQVAAALDTASPDACSVGGLVIEIDGLRDDIGELHDAYVSDFEALLTPAQLTKWEALQAACQAQDRIPGA